MTPVLPETDVRSNVSVPISGSCPKCGSKGVRLEAVGLMVDLVHDQCMREHGQEHRAYAGPVTGLPTTSALALELALAR